VSSSFRDYDALEASPYIFPLGFLKNIIYSFQQVAAVGSEVGEETRRSWGAIYFGLPQFISSDFDQHFIIHQN
jgi:hypothetical protein